ncbi:MAG: hypothetical protein P8188_14815, partial [Gemmatimonadota bacterium]
MSLLTPLHAILAGMLLAAAAGSADWGLRRLGLPTRWVWLATLLITATTPLWSPLVPNLFPGSPGMDLDALEALVVTESSSPGASPGSTPAWAGLQKDRGWIPVAWFFLAGAGLLVLAGGLGRLGRKTRLWPRA